MLSGLYLQHPVIIGHRLLELPFYKKNIANHQVGKTVFSPSFMALTAFFSACGIIPPASRDWQE